ncbi:MAG TPA: hypothetical protein VNO81_06115, partial [Candidatus Nitrosotenuis sp.]|nr:hypothetical protein [Candidatus Nitrosotenuis sp.]
MTCVLCPGCRSPLEEEGEFCPRCGMRTRRSAGSGFLIGALLALLVLGAGWAGYRLGAQESGSRGSQQVGLPPPVEAAAPEPSFPGASRDEEAIARVKAWDLGGSSVEARLQTVEAWLRGSALMGEMPGSWSARQDSEFPDYYLVRLTWITAFGPRELLWRVNMAEGSVTPANALATRLETFEGLQGDPAAFLV